jgi:hypothetical protein
MKLLVDLLAYNHSNRGYITYLLTYDTYPLLHRLFSSVVCVCGVSKVFRIKLLGCGQITIEP